MRSLQPLLAVNNYRGFNRHPAWPARFSLSRSREFCYLLVGRSSVCRGSRSGSPQGTSGCRQRFVRQSASRGHPRLWERDLRWFILGPQGAPQPPTGRGGWMPKQRGPRRDRRPWQMLREEAGESALPCWAVSGSAGSAGSAPAGGTQSLSSWCEVSSFPKVRVRSRPKTQGVTLGGGGIGKGSWVGGTP